MVDQVKVVADDQAPAEQSLRRNLTNRHIQLIAIGGAIGTGLFMGSGKTISLAGPSIIFVYMIIGLCSFRDAGNGGIAAFESGIQIF
ncbi:D-serine/D-alanine/glycine transporter [Escherichia coli]|uniref:D-serine/D-alanine/glycine transporter n=1 Tax=Escherichia coli TaxID=562 RepID=A0A376U2Z9_ECOLX|nr:D-serine/D-alanine/glycine transporter [Escherichia coli]